MEANLPGNVDLSSRVLHISGDYPDSFDTFKTPVIRTLVELTRTQFNHEVISINRRSPRIAGFALQTLLKFGQPSLAISEKPFEDGKALTYGAPPKGIFHAAMLHQMGDYIVKHIDNQPISPDLIVGHKLAIEGIAVLRVAERTGIPYAISIQGDTDTRILDARPDLRRELAKVFHGAAIVFPFSPWSLERVEARLGVRNGPVTMLPCPTDIDVPIAPNATGDGFISVFHLKNYVRKNLQSMADAVRLLEKNSAQQWPLTVIGGGNADEIAHCATIADGAKGISFAGPMDREALRARMATATGFVMPSLRESFGMVFVEALFCGLPIIYPAGTSVDGYFDNAPFAIRVDARDPSAIAAAMRHVRNNEASIKAALAQWQKSADAQRFTRRAIGQAFASGLELAISR